MKAPFLQLGRGSAVNIFSQSMSELINELISDGGVCRAAPGFAKVC